ncbi:hypothetical protein BDV96DRAFT_570965 [Lophiotrema nucula]|uniref:Uncharacterized protein n=1 Tax=Lophiotrema nucula TaxID=690887 RepID=A0A6A5ZHH0_9PLEO|nr:hypothetical protein BDV96DRAFT_570965 [Lophiotrema nucula]
MLLEPHPDKHVLRARLNPHTRQPFTRSRPKSQRSPQTQFILQPQPSTQTLLNGRSARFLLPSSIHSHIPNQKTVVHTAPSPCPFPNPPAHTRLNPVQK